MPPDAPTRVAAPERPEAPLRFRRNREEVAWLVFVLVVAGAFGVTATLVFLARLQAEAIVGRFDVAFDVLWGVLCVGLLGTLGYYAYEVRRFLRRVVVIDRTGVHVGRQHIGWEDLGELREERVKRRHHTFCRLELARADGSFVPVSSAQVADYDGFRDRVARGRPDLVLALIEH